MSRPLNSVLWRDRVVSLAGLLTLTVLAWTYIIHLAAGMQQMGEAMVMPSLHPWDWREVLGLCVMWSVMMMAMMIPAAAPVILLFESISRRRRSQGIASASTAVFVLGYLVVWIGYSAVAAILQGQLHSRALLSAGMASQSPWLGGALLVLAGIYQWLPMKQQCLTHCRSPLSFFTSEWREGNSGALLMGIRHGSYCVGCCWLLMALLFVLGVMNLLWVAILSTAVLIEKLAHQGRVFGRVNGLLLIGWGTWLLLARP